MRSDARRLEHNAPTATLTTDADWLSAEASIGRLEVIELFDYVREAVHYAGTRRGRPRSPEPRHGRMVGYSILRPGARSRWPHLFCRRLFYVTIHDRSEKPDGPYRTSAPREGVDPRTVRPGVRGKFTQRAWGAPL